MRFLVDAHLPRKLAELLKTRGHEAIHTLEFPNANRSTDTELMNYADANGFVVITKDADFVDAFYVRDTPQKLWLISTGNIGNKDLEKLIDANFETVIEAFQQHRFVELSRTEIFVHI
jgi:predicted nuclease of predicted toxin-antitoxin system